MTKDDLFNWASNNLWEYPALNYLREEVIDNVHFLILPGKRGVYRGLCLCFYENSVVDKLRKEKYAVGIVKDYEAAREIILDCVQFLKKFEAEKIKNKKNKFN